MGQDPLQLVGTRGGDLGRARRAHVDVAAREQAPEPGDAAVGTFHTNYWDIDSKNPVNQKFIKDFIAKYDYHPSHFSAQAYDAARLFEEDAFWKDSFQRLHHAQGDGGGNQGTQ